jgi:hypothetical protein
MHPAKSKNLLRGKPAQELYPILGRAQPKSWTQSNSNQSCSCSYGREESDLSKIFKNVLGKPFWSREGARWCYRTKSSSSGRINLPQ